ncbi:peptidoglycan-binding protein [Ochrobactrum sp. CM-21-5]|nr:peptidoglycan-binding protein [Ochrobactrum sp. CM-21-5]MBC2884724.1 peptidoglycan-binding protein [Ochrobactrum sp. CM-21-5]
MRKSAKRRSPGGRLLHFFFNSASAIAIAAGDFIVRNPVLTGGATAFAVVMGFVSANALWYQPEAHNAVFFRTRPDFVFKATPRSVLPGTLAVSADSKPAGDVHNAVAAKPAEIVDPAQTQTAELSPDRLQTTGSVDEMLPALAPNADVEIARLQQRLATLGIYKGSVDGFSGPQTREAMERWRALQQKLGVGQAGTPAGVDDRADDNVAKIITLAVPAPRPEPAVLKTQTPSKRAPDLSSLESRPAPEKKPAAATATPKPANVSSQDIVRVQAGLKAFGNDLVRVDGTPGKATQEAIREFQKLFGMRVTGEIDAVLIGKMREIGLIS